MKSMTYSEEIEKAVRYVICYERLLEENLVSNFHPLTIGREEKSGFECLILNIKDICDAYNLDFNVLEA